MAAHEDEFKHFSSRIYDKDIMTNGTVLSLIFHNPVIERQVGVVLLIVKVVSAWISGPVMATDTPHCGLLHAQKLTAINVMECSSPPGSLSGRHFYVVFSHDVKLTHLPCQIAFGNLLE